MNHFGQVMIQQINVASESVLFIINWNFIEILKRVNYYYLYEYHYWLAKIGYTVSICISSEYPISVLNISMIIRLKMIKLWISTALLLISGHITFVDIVHTSIWFICGNCCSVQQITSSNQRSDGDDDDAKEKNEQFNFVMRETSFLEFSVSGIKEQTNVYMWDHLNLNTFNAFSNDSTHTLS